MLVCLGHGTVQPKACIGFFSGHSGASFSSLRGEPACPLVACSPYIRKSSKPPRLLGGTVLNLRESQDRLCVPFVSSFSSCRVSLSESKLGQGDALDDFRERVQRQELELDASTPASLRGPGCEQRNIQVVGHGQESRHNQSAMSLMRRDFLLLASNAACCAAFLADLPIAHAFVDEEQGIGGVGEGAVDVRGRHVIITGGNSGIGKATAMDLARKGMTVVLACRSQERGDAAAAEIIAQTGNGNVRAMLCDLASLRSVRQFASDYIQTGLPLHVLVNNAGVMATPKMYTEDGFELQFGTNHIGHFALTSLLTDSLIRSATEGRKSRVVVVSSKAETLGSIDFSDLNFDSTRQYNPWAAYAQSKLANVLFTRELARRCELQGLPLTANSMHPGVVDTELIRYVLPKNVMEARASAGASASKFARFIGLKTPEEGAATVVYLAASGEVEGRSGGFYDNLRLEMPSSKARDDALAKRLWTVSEELTGAIFSLDQALSYAT